MATETLTGVDANADRSIASNSRMGVRGTSCQVVTDARLRYSIRPLRPDDSASS